MYPEADRQKATVKVEAQIRQPNLAMIRPEMSVKANFLAKGVPKTRSARLSFRRKPCCGKAIACMYGRCGVEK